MQLEPDRDQIEIFTDALFRHARAGGFVSLRSFLEGVDKPFRIIAAGVGSTLRLVNEQAVINARLCANHTQGVVFCPPIATFKARGGAKESDIAEGLALSVECDKNPEKARLALEELLGPATVVVSSGGVWTDPETGEAQGKLHLHWRLSSPATGAALASLKQARDIASRIVGSDPSGKSVVHPYRWPGSWHRKGQAILCRIETADPDREIDLAGALEALATAYPGHAKPNGKDHSYDGGWRRLVERGRRGYRRHQLSQRARVVAAKMITAGMSGGATVNMLRALMETSTGVRDERWKRRYDDIPRRSRRRRGNSVRQIRRRPLPRIRVKNRPSRSLCRARNSSRGSRPPTT